MTVSPEAAGLRRTSTGRWTQSEKLATMPQGKSAHRQLVHQLIDWDLIETRLERYPAIRKAFPLATLLNYRENSPYYCHYMSWRLGTWQDEAKFRRLEQLLRCADELPHWKHEKSLLTSRDDAFWSLVWQLQVAEYLCEVGESISWAKSGPDLSAIVGGRRLHVECLVLQKSFPLLRFVEELLQKLDPSVRLLYDLCLPFQLPNNSDRDQFLDKVLNPFTDPTRLAIAKEQAEQSYPVVLYKDPSSTLYIYVNGNDTDAYVPGIVPNRVGDPGTYVKTVLREAIGNKKDANKLSRHRPNLLAVNYLLSADFQVAELLPHRMKFPTLPQPGPNIDALGAFVVGINERLSEQKLKGAIEAADVRLSPLEQIGLKTPRSTSPSSP